MIQLRQERVTNKMVLPLKNPKITSFYEQTRYINGKKTLHKGLDMISMSGDRNVVSVKDGTYRGAFYDKNGFGNYVVVQHDDKIRTIYGHLESINKELKAGQYIKAGTFLGIEGTTGRSTGIHLHIEARKSPYLTTNRIDIAEYLGIINAKGLADFKIKARAMQVVQTKTGFADKTMDYLNAYNFSNDLFIKLAKAMGVEV